MKQRLLYGKEGLEITLPDNVRVDVVEPKYEEGLPDQIGVARRALEDPIDSPPLVDVVEEGMKVGIVLNDITRATPYHVMLPPLVEILESKGAELVFLNATGTHRTNTDEELTAILGEEIFGKYPIVQNECLDEDSHTYIGTTSRGNEVRIHSTLLECDLKILTGFIEPHFFAGYSGGGKAMMPGLAQLS
ncbi:MAG: lactate racemase domain-containing protein, partial [Spirochaetia bacterium]